MRRDAAEGRGYGKWNGRSGLGAGVVSKRGVAGQRVG